MINTLEYTEGQEAYNDGLSLINNPYTSDPDKYDAWQEGYFDAQEADEE